jgi:hypothetical protein
MTQHLLLDDGHFDSLDAGTKGLTIRKGYRPEYQPGMLTFESTRGTKGCRTVEVYEVRFKTLGRLTAEEAERNGQPSLAAQYASLARFYPGLKMSDPITVLIHSSPVDESC